MLGRSGCYRHGVFHTLSQASLLHMQPEELSPATVRSALTAVIRSQNIRETFDRKGWFTLGFCGHQPSVAKTGSADLCTFVFLLLGLPADGPFRATPAETWLSQQAWGGEDIIRDAAIGD